MSIPTEFRKLEAIAIGNDFEKVTRLVTVRYDSLLNNLAPGNVVLKNIYVGINASDVNYTNGKYVAGIKPPFDVGFEALGQVVAVGAKIPKEAIGKFVVYTQYGAFAEYISVPYKTTLAVKSDTPANLGLLVSGLTASISLTVQGRMTKGETVLVTAAAGGAGQFAVQLAKIAGNHVIGTCSSDDKVEMLKAMGCDRVINYKKEDFRSVLKNEYPNGIDIVFESVGGEFFKICLNGLSDKGRLIVIGTVASYSTPEGIRGDTVNTLQLLSKSRSVCGFFLPAYAAQFGEHMNNLTKLLEQGKLTVQIDSGGFQGIEQVTEAVKYISSGQNKGKVVISLLEPRAKY
ncbi:putative oxidoreductase [Spinellus fusiger]|nr:putative oxidoreductase [Spinellus fusiger]